MKLPSFLSRFLVILAVCGAGLIPALPARADVMIMPIRIVFGTHDRMEDITVFNSSNTRAEKYTLAWLNVRQTDDGGYKELKGPLNPELDPAKNIMFSPREVTLSPGGKQRLRLALRRPPNLPDGEYRAHLYLKSMAAQPVTSMRMAAASSTVGVGMYVGLAVPVIIRQGKYDGSASIGAPKFTPGSFDGKTPPQIDFVITRAGKFSTIGNVTVYWTPPGGKEKVVGAQNAVNIFPEVAQRKMRIPLSEKRIIGGSLRITFVGDGPDKDIKFDEKTFPVGG